jgi:hypothetical protein
LSFSLFSSPFLLAGLAPNGTSFSPTLAAAFFLVAFFFCWVFEAGLGDVDLPLPAEPEPEPNPVDEARCRVDVAFAEENCVALRN